MTEDPDSLMMLVRFQAVRGMNADGFRVHPSPWGFPHTLWLYGTSDEGPAIALVHEFPTSYFPMTTKLPKRFIESIQIGRLNTDHRLATGSVLAEEIRDGGDPPDFYLINQGVTTGVECTSLTVPGRRELNGLFQTIREAISRQPANAFLGLQGTVVSVAFENSEGVPAKPFRKDDFPSIDALLNALNEYSFQLNMLKVPGSELPPFFDTSDLLGRSAGATTFVANPIIGSAPDSALFLMRGFEIVVSYPTPLSIAEVEAELARIVHSHDKLGVDVLLVSCGSPSSDGLIYASDEIMGQFYLEHGRPLDECEHIKSVLLHFWGTGETHEVYREKRRILKPIYEGVVPRHRPLKSESTSELSDNTSENARAR